MSRADQADRLLMDSKQATYSPAPWSMWTSCSYRRIGSDHGRGRTVCEGAVQLSDGHPDLHFPNGGYQGPDARLMLAAPDLADALLGLDLTCGNDALNPCWDGRPTDVAGQHWGEGKACPQCTARAALAKALLP